MTYASYLYDLRQYSYRNYCSTYVLIVFLCYICKILSCTRQIESKLSLHSFAKYLHNIMETTKFRTTTYIMEMFSERTYLLTLRNSVTFHFGMA